MKKTILWAAAVIAVVATLALLWMRQHSWRSRTITIQGAVIYNNIDPRKQRPIAGATVTASNGVSSVSVQSEASGYFKIVLPTDVWPKSLVRLSVSRPEYKPFELEFQQGLRSPGKLFVVALDPAIQPTKPEPAGHISVVSNVRIRYTVNQQEETNIGSAVKTFQVVNQGNVPCDHRQPCSPNGRWKASTGSVTLDAGPGNVFRDVRASCIAGPCPFTLINSSNFVKGGRVIAASALDWSDTATFLLEAEVFRNSLESSVRESYPVIFGRTLHFTLPPMQEGVSIEAEIDSTPMVFPLGPDLYLSWADCSARTSGEADKSTVYQCELRPGYSF